MKLFIIFTMLIISVYSIPDSCSLEPVTGPCRAMQRKYFFNETSGKCEMFIYGGCRGNKNNFSSEEECKTYCN